MIGREWEAGGQFQPHGHKDGRVLLTDSQQERRWVSRKGRMSEFAARLMYAELAHRPGVETELIDLCWLPIPVDDAGEAIKDPGFSSKMNRADALTIVSPEYIHGYSGLLKHLLDSCLKEYVHKGWRCRRIGRQ